MANSTKPAANGPVVLIVRDGWGTNPNPEHDAFNAVKLAATPVCDKMLVQYPWTLIKTSGKDVGLSEGTMGNSEVGHQNLGAGRIVDQDSVRITKATQNGTFYENEVLVEAVRRAKEADKTVHLLGIASDAGVHGMMTHLFACLQLCTQHNHDRVALHLLTDGRDTGPFTGKDFIGRIQAACKKMSVGCIASICGRYYAMDRDNRWQRIAKAYDLLTGRAANLPHFTTGRQAVQDYYDHPTHDRQVGDEFITPRTIGDDTRHTRISDGDSVIFYNYRGDRPRELVKAFQLDNAQWADVAPSPDSGQRGFDRGRKLDLHFVTMTAYQEGLPVHVAFARGAKMADIGGQYLSSLGLKQFRCGETEKFAHVTFFFNDYREEPFKGETRLMAQSPQVATYDRQPQMSAQQVTALVLDNLVQNDFVLVNFANCDMVGHTGKLEAAIEAVQTVDGCVGRIVEAAMALGGRLIVTADHGNAEQMFDPHTNSPNTAHTTCDVECIVVDPQLRGKSLRPGGRLADVMPTVLSLMGLEKPQAMSGNSLIE